MTEPTGYTALDLVGFTDKGNYNAATAYVKNDLVHYSGDIWRCLVDDTTNITPVEGANWTLFIEAPTNAIEGIIAPVETNPTTNSYAVGRRFIYNDKLYEVITAITAGDALVAYEDDPSNANIQLADPVETQLFELTSSLTDKYIISSPDQIYSYTSGSSDDFAAAIVGLLSNFYNNVVLNLDDNESVRILNIVVGSLTYTPEWNEYFTNSSTSISVMVTRISLTSTGANIREIYATNTALGRFNVLVINSSGTITFTDYSGNTFASSPLAIEYEIYKKLS